METNGYLYAQREGHKDDVLYRTYGPKWANLIQVRRVNTQDNAGGGQLVTRVSLPTGMTAQLVSLYVRGSASAGATLSVLKLDEDGATVNVVANVGAAANNTVSLPSIGTAANGSNNVVYSHKLMLGPGEYLSATCSAALQTETLTVGIELIAPIGFTDASLTWDTTGSAGTPNLAASTISATNSTQPVLMP